MIQENTARPFKDDRLEVPAGRPKMTGPDRVTGWLDCISLHTWMQLEVPGFRIWDNAEDLEHGGWEFTFLPTDPTAGAFVKDAEATISFLQFFSTDEIVFRHISELRVHKAARNLEADRVIELRENLSDWDLQPENIAQTARVLADVADGLEHISPLEIQDILEAG